MTDREIMDHIFGSHLKTEDYFTSVIFYYLAGRFPDMSIDRCARIVDMIRQTILG